MGSPKINYFFLSDDRIPTKQEYNFVECEQQKQMTQQNHTQPEDAIFPCVLDILPGHIINRRNPIILGIHVSDGLLKVRTLLSVQKTVIDIDDKGYTKTQRNMFYIGKVTSLKDTHTMNDIQQATTNQQAVVSIEGGAFVFGAQFDDTYKLYGHISRESIDALKEHFRDFLTSHIHIMRLVYRLKPMFDIQWKTLSLYKTK